MEIIVLPPQELNHHLLQLGHAGEGVEIMGCRNALDYGYQQLQLGHAGEGVEISLNIDQSPILPIASIGHAGEGVEMMIFSKFSSCRCWLQLGHAGEGVEIRR